MKNIVATSTVSGHHNRFENGPLRMAKADLKNLEWRAQVGAAIGKALQLAGKTQKEAWVLLGHNDGAQLNRWLAGTERPQFDALFAVEGFRQPLVLALAELCGAGVEIETTVRIRRSA